MNYEGMQLDILEVFAEAQSPAAKDIVERLERAEREHLMGWKGKDEYARQCAAATALGPRPQIVTCGQCGGPAQLRPGVSFAIHVGGQIKRCTNGALHSFYKSVA